MSGKVETPLTQLKKKFRTNAEKLSAFVRWYCDFEDEREDFETYSKKFLGGVTWETAQYWLFRDDVQDAIIFWESKIKLIKLMRVYKTMYNQAENKGNVNAANWVEKFSKNDLFTSVEDEANLYLDGINIPGIKGSDKNGNK